jgi:hypothetical protein
MTNPVVLADPGHQISAACRMSRADVAVAYVSQGAATLLPLRRGSRLVVDASEAAVRCGQTDPRELLRYFRTGVEVYSRPRLHAKVFAFLNVAFVGSTNVSSRSAHHLLEAAVVLRSKKAVAEAGAFVRQIAQSPLGEEFLKKLAGIYRPPRVPGARRRRGRHVEREVSLVEAMPLRIAQLVPASWGDGENDADEAGRAEARKKKTRGFTLDSFSYARWPRGSMDEEVIQVFKEGTRNVTVFPPGRVLAVRKVRGKKRSVVVLEMPPRNARKLATLRKRLSASTVKRLSRGGRLAPKHAANVRQLWA